MRYHAMPCGRRRGSRNLVPLDPRYYSALTALRGHFWFLDKCQGTTMLAAPPALFVCMLSSLRSAYDSCEPGSGLFCLSLHLSLHFGRSVAHTHMRGIRCAPFRLSTVVRLWQES